MARRLTPAQERLLEEFRESETGLYIRRNSRYSPTVRVLLNRGLIRRDEQDYSTYGADHYVAVEQEGVCGG